MFRWKVNPYLAASPGRPGDHRIAEEQAALRRVATLVAEGASPEGLFAAVAAEGGQLLQADFAVLSRYEPDGAAVVVGGWARTDRGRPLPVGARLEPGLALANLSELTGLRANEVGRQS